MNRLEGIRLGEISQTEKGNTIWFYLCVESENQNKQKTKQQKQTQRYREQGDGCLTGGEWEDG